MFFAKCHNGIHVSVGFWLDDRLGDTSVYKLSKKIEFKQRDECILSSEKALKVHIKRVISKSIQYNN